MCPTQLCLSLNLTQQNSGGKILPVFWILLLVSKAIACAESNAYEGQGMSVKTVCSNTPQHQSAVGTISINSLVRASDLCNRKTLLQRYKLGQIRFYKCTRACRPRGFFLNRNTADLPFTQQKDNLECG